MLTRSEAMLTRSEAMLTRSEAMLNVQVENYGQAIHRFYP